MNLSLSLSDDTTNPDDRTAARRDSSSLLDRSSLYVRAPALSPSPPSSPSRRDRPFSQHNRRLQLRHAGFRGAQLLQRRVSPGIPGCVSGLSAGTETSPDESDEIVGTTRGSHPTDPDEITSPRSQSRSQSRRTSNILQEIEKSTKRHRIASARPSVAALFQPSPPTSPTSHQQQRQHQLQDITEVGETMNPKDGSSSLRSRFSSLNRPKRRETSSHPTKRDTTRYIEHLEAQLAASLDRADTLDSSASDAHASKIKSLTAELRVLKQELTEWEGGFEDRVQDELGSMVERESQFRARIRALEKDVELKESQIRELEWEVEMGASRLRNMDALKSTNRNLEKRVDVLTELLAQSSNKTDTGDLASSHGVDVSSPQSENDTSTPRPKSMFSKTPLSPVRRPLSQPLNESPSISGILEESTIDDTNSGAGDPFTHSRGLSHSSMYTSDLDSGLGGSCSQPSTGAPESQRSSIVSQSSSASSLCRTSFPLSPDFQGKLQHRHKRMRCFPSGSSTLKPLVLPATTATSPSSGSSIPSPTHAHEPASQRQFDGTGDDLFFSESSSLGAYDDTLDALEGNSHQYQTFEEAISGHTMADALETTHDSFDDDVDFPRTGLYDTGFGAPKEIPDNTAVGGSVRRSRRGPALLSVASSARRRRRPADRNATLQPDDLLERPKRRQPSPSPSPFPVKVAPGLSWLPVQYIGDLFTHCGILARRILVHAWHSKWRKVRKLSCWILGLMLGKSRRNAWFPTLRRGEGACSASCWDNTNRNFQYARQVSNNVSTPSPKSRALSGTRLSVQGKRSPARNPNPNVEDGSHPLTRSIQLWAKFSFALVLAVGLAIRDGPGSAMCDCTGQIATGYKTHPTSVLEPSVRNTPTQARHPTLQGPADPDIIDDEEEEEEEEEDGDGEAGPPTGMNTIDTAQALER